MSRPTRRFLCFAFCLALLGPWPLLARADVALDWISTVDDATAKLPGLRGDRARTIAWLAAFNALDAIDPRYRPYPPAPPALPADAVKPSRDAALAAALYTVLVIEPDADQALLVRRYRETLAAVKVAGERDAGVTLGQQAALMLLAARSADRLGRIDAPVREAAEGVFVSATPAKPRSMAILELAPFGVRAFTGFDPGPPPAPGSAAAGREMAEVRALGAVASASRSGDQTAAALFWVTSEPADFSSLMKRALEAKRLDALDVARVMALDAMIGVDVAIVGTTLKERYLRWRPETAIAGPFAAADREAGWRPLVAAPNSPEYPSTGAVSAGVLAVELPRLFAMDGAIELQNSRTQQTRRWPSAATLGQELAESRIWAGAHFRSSIDAGRQVGTRVATEILDRQLLPR